MLKGKIVLYDQKKQNGHVRVPDTRETFFFQLKPEEVNPGIQLNAWVMFRLYQDRQGYRAIELQPLLVA